MISPEYFILIGSSLIIFGLLLSKAGFKIGIPILLLFLAIGMLAGNEGLGINFESPYKTQFIGVIALIIILYSGGMDTDYSEIKPRIKEGISLATIGVLLTTFITGTFIYFIFKLVFIPFELTYLQSLLCASVMSSTDSASVFSILRSKDVNLKQNIRPTLELESGSNDPMAYMITIIIIQIMQVGADISAKEIIITLFLQFFVGIIFGFLISKLSVWILNKIELQNASLYAIFLLAFAGITYSVTDACHGNGLLAVYIGGLIVGNSKLNFKKTIRGFFDGFAWLAQLVVFLTLGLLVIPSHLISIAIPSVIVGIFLILLGRPLASFLVFAAIRSNLSIKAQTYISWMGLRGAAPIIFATYPLVMGIEHADIIFNIVFFITLLSLIIQGSTSTWFAFKLDLVDKSLPKKAFNLDFPDEIKSAVSEILVTEELLSNGNTLKDISLPMHTLVIMVLRQDNYFIPRGDTSLKLNDHILLISDDENALMEYYEQTGIKPYRMERNV